MTSRLSGDWPTLALFTARILADRRNSYHEEDDRIRVMAAIAELWRRIDAHQDVPAFDEHEALGAWWAEMREDLQVLAERARSRANTAARRADMDDAQKRGAARTATRAEELLVYHSPAPRCIGPTPLIVHCHIINQQQRQRTSMAERQAA